MRPGTVTIVHRVRVQAGVLPEALVQSNDRVVFDERVVAGEHVALFGVEEEHQSQDHGEEGSVYVVGVLFQFMSQQGAVRLLMGRLETPQQLVQTMQHLLRELFADDVLVLPARFEESRQALSLGQRQEPFFG